MGSAENVENVAHISKVKTERQNYFTNMKIENEGFSFCLKINNLALDQQIKHTHTHDLSLLLFYTRSIFTRSLEHHTILYTVILLFILFILVLVCIRKYWGLDQFQYRSSHIFFLFLIIRAVKLKSKTIKYLHFPVRECFFLFFFCSLHWLKTKLLQTMWTENSKTTVCTPGLWMKNKVIQRLAEFQLNRPMYDDICCCSFSLSRLYLVFVPKSTSERLRVFELCKCILTSGYTILCWCVFVVFFFFTLDSHHTHAYEQAHMREIRSYIGFIQRVCV